MDIKLDPRYWECCCETNYVHSKFGELDMCERCGNTDAKQTVYLESTHEA